MRREQLLKSLIGPAIFIVVVGIVGCAEEQAHDTAGVEETHGNDQGSAASTDPEMVETGLEEILKTGAGYVDLLASIRNADDARESWDELNRYARDMQALGTKYAAAQGEITLRMDTSAQFKEFNQRLQTEMMRLNSDPDIAQMFLALGQADSTGSGSK